MSDLEEAEEAYEQAEAAYLAGIRVGADRATLTELVCAVAQSADAYNTFAYRAFHGAVEGERTDLDALTERTEVLSELWADVLAAYRNWTGDFQAGEDSERARELSAFWDATWPGFVPGAGQRPARDAGRCARFHNLPGGKRYPESDEETTEILRRQRALLAELMGQTPAESLVVIGPDYPPDDLATGWTRQHLPGAWPWRRIFDEGYTDRWIFLWATSGLAGAELDSLLVAAATGTASPTIVLPDAEWIFAPYDGGVDILFPTEAACADAERRFASWRPEPF